MRLLSIPAATIGGMTPSAGPGEAHQVLYASAQHCPYCGEPIELLVEGGVGDQQYVEDCQVCCRPIQVHVGDDGDGEAGAPHVRVATENGV